MNSLEELLKFAYQDEYITCRLFPYQVDTLAFGMVDRRTGFLVDTCRIIPPDVVFDKLQHLARARSVVLDIDRDAGLIKVMSPEIPEEVYRRFL